MKMESVQKALFLLSLVFLSYLYGSAARAFRWFPSPQLDPVFRRAFQESKALNPFRSPVYVGPRVYDRQGVAARASAETGAAPVLIVTAWEDFEWMPGLKLIDRDGRVIHEWQVDPASILSPALSRSLARRDLDLQGSHLFENGDVMVNIEYAGLVRLDSCSRVRWTLERANHHSIARADDGTFWVPAVTGLEPPESEAFPRGYPGLADPVYHDLILEVGEDGRVLKEISVLDVLYLNDLQRYISKAGRTNSEDVTHLNDVEPLPESMADEYPLFDAGDLVVSLRNLDLVLVLDPATGAVKWLASEPFHQQHDPDFVGDGWIGIFDNNSDGTDRGTLAGGSRIVLLQPHSDSMTVDFPTSQSEPFHTAYRGKWQRLPNGNMLLTESVAGRIVETTPDGRTVWEWISPPYEESGIPEVSEGVQYDLDREAVSSWPCSPRNSDRPAPRAP